MTREAEIEAQTERASKQPASYPPGSRLADLRYLLGRVEALEKELRISNSWDCGCGHRNGCNLDKCSACSRPPGGWPEERAALEREGGA